MKPCPCHPLATHENSWPLVAHCLFNCFMVFLCTVWEETCEICLPTVTQTTQGDQHHLQSGKNHSNCRWSPSLLSQTRLWTPATHLHLPSQHPKLGVRPYCSQSSRCAYTVCPSSLLRGEGILQHLLALANTEGTEKHWEGHKVWAWSFEAMWDRGNLCEGEKRQATSWRCGSMKQRTGSMQTCPCSFFSSRHQLYACFCFSPGRGHTRRHLGASHSSHLPLEYKVRGYQSYHTLVKAGNVQEKKTRVCFLIFLSHFFWLLQVCKDYIITCTRCRSTHTTPAPTSRVQGPEICR